VFERKRENVGISLGRFVDCWCRYVAAMESQKGLHKGKGTEAVKWVPPHREACKANVDASIGKDRRRGIGVVVRNSKGEIRLAACKCIRANWEVDTTEAFAALYAMKLCWEAGIRRLELETDSKTTAKVGPSKADPTRLPT